jgi:Domain of unknown function (DUF4157)
MSVRSIAQAQKTAPVSVPVNAGVLQRSYASSQHAAGGEHEEDSKKKSSIVHRSVFQQDRDTPRPSQNGNGNLPDSVKKEMKTRFGSDFSGVRVHADARAGSQALEIGAKAFTKSGEIYFAPGHYQPDTRTGRALIAHELTHVMQQKQGGVSGGWGSLGTIASSQSNLEREAMNAEKGFLNTRGPIHVRESANDHAINRSPSETLDAIRAAASGGILAVADWVVQEAGAADAAIRKLNALRNELKNAGKAILLSPEAIAQMARMYAAFQPYIPSWLPVPDITFRTAQTAAPLFVIAGVAITLEILILIVAFFLVMMWLLQRLNPTVRKQQDQAVEDLVNKIRESLKPKTKPATPPEVDTNPKQEADPNPKGDPDQKPKGDPDPKTGPDFPPPPLGQPRQRRRSPRAYPICWPTQLGPPFSKDFVRTKSERDEVEATQARMALNWRQFRDPDFDPTKFHVHHVDPLFLGGPDDLQGNATTIPKRLHLRGHASLRKQPQMVLPPPPLRPLPIDLYAHPIGTPYRLVGFKDTSDEWCEEP